MVININNHIKLLSTYSKKNKFQIIAELIYSYFYIVFCCWLLSRTYWTIQFSSNAPQHSRTEVELIQIFMPSTTNCATL